MTTAPSRAPLPYGFKVKRSPELLPGAMTAHQRDRLWLVEPGLSLQAATLALFLNSTELAHWSLAFSPFLIYTPGSSTSTATSKEIQQTRLNLSSGAELLDLI